ncbi:MAG: glycosyltransferase [Candidatus Omnitrophota bacterium]
MKNTLRHLPEKTLGKAGRDYSSRDKELTVVIFPYESHSAFPKAIQGLYKLLQIPFNLIVIEGNAPDGVRSQLEECENRYGSMSVLYSTKYLSPGEVIHLARPHIKTDYCFFMDSEIQIRPGGIERMLGNAKNWNADVVFPKHSLITRQFKTRDQDRLSLETPGMRLAFLMATGSLAKLTRVDKRTDFYTAGWDLMLEFRSKGFQTMVSDEAWVESLPEHGIRRNDRLLFRHRWDLEQHRHLVNYFQQKWDLEIQDGLYQRWFESKSRQAAALASAPFFSWENLLDLTLANRARFKARARYLEQAATLIGKTSLQNAGAVPQS